MADYVNPITDFGFKRIFGDKEVMTAFINDLFGTDGTISIVEYLPQEELPEATPFRNVIYDIHCKAASGEEFIVEMQNKRQTNFRDRILYYLSRARTYQKLKGDRKWNFELWPVIGIFFANFTLNPDKPKAIHVVKHIEEDDGTVFTDKERYYVIELPEYQKKSESDCKTKADYWMYNLSKMETMNSAEAIPFVDKQPAFRKMFTIAEVANMSEAELAAYNISQEDQWTANAVIDYAEKQGEERGIKKIACKMLDADVPSAQIAAFTGLSVNEIIRLAADRNGNQ